MGKMTEKFKSQTKIGNGRKHVKYLEFFSQNRGGIKWSLLCTLIKIVLGVQSSRITNILLILISGTLLNS